MERDEYEMGLPEHDLPDAYEDAPEPFGSEGPEEYQFDDWALI